MKRGKIAISIVLILVLSISAQAITFTDILTTIKDFFSGTPTGAQVVPLAVDGCTSFGAGGFPIVGATLTAADTITYSQTAYSAGSVSITVLAPPITASTMSITTTGGATFGTITIPAAPGLHVLPITLAASPLMPTLGGNCVITRTGGIGAFTVAAGATITLTPIIPPPTPTPSAGGGGGGAKTKTWTYVESWEPEVTQPCKPGSQVQLMLTNVDWNNADGLWFARQDNVQAIVYENNNVKEKYTYKIEQTTDTPINIPNSETWAGTGNTYQIILQTGYSGLKPIAPRREYQVNIECPGTAVPTTAPPKAYPISITPEKYQEYYDQGQGTDPTTPPLFTEDQQQGWESYIENKPDCVVYNVQHPCAIRAVNQGRFPDEKFPYGERNYFIVTATYQKCPGYNPTLLETSTSPCTAADEGKYVQDLIQPPYVEIEPEQPEEEVVVEPTIQISEVVPKITACVGETSILEKECHETGPILPRPNTQIFIQGQSQTTPHVGAYMKLKKTVTEFSGYNCPPPKITEEYTACPFESIPEKRPCANSQKITNRDCEEIKPPAGAKVIGEATFYRTETIENIECTGVNPNCNCESHSTSTYYPCPGYQKCPGPISEITSSDCIKVTPPDGSIVDGNKIKQDPINPLTGNYKKNTQEVTSYDPPPECPAKTVKIEEYTSCDPKQPTTCQKSEQTEVHIPCSWMSITDVSLSGMKVVDAKGKTTVPTKPFSGMYEVFGTDTTVYVPPPKCNVAITTSTRTYRACDTPFDPPAIGICCCMQGIGAFSFTQKDKCGNCVSDHMCNFEECPGCPEICPMPPPLIAPPQPAGPGKPPSGGGGGGPQQPFGGMDPSSGPPQNCQGTSLSVGGGCAPRCTPQNINKHILVTEIFASDTEPNFIEIYNPVPMEIDISEYQLTNAISNDYNDNWVIRFPKGTTMNPGDRITIALSDDILYERSFGKKPDFEITWDNDDVKGMIVENGGEAINEADNLVSTTSKLLNPFTLTAEPDESTQTPISTINTPSASLITGLQFLEQIGMLPAKQTKKEPPKETPTQFINTPIRLNGNAMTIVLFTGGQDVDIVRIGNGYPIQKNDRDTEPSEQHAMYPSLQWTPERILGLSPKKTEREQYEEATKLISGQSVEVTRPKEEQKTRALGITGLATADEASISISTNDKISLIQTAANIAKAQNEEPHMPTSQLKEALTNLDYEAEGVDMKKALMNTLMPYDELWLSQQTKPIYRSYQRIDYNEGGELRAGAPPTEQETLNINQFGAGKPTFEECNEYFDEKIFPEQDLSQQAYNVLLERNGIEGYNKFQTCQQMSALLNECKQTEKATALATTNVATTGLSTTLTTGESITKATGTSTSLITGFATAETTQYPPEYDVLTEQEKEAMKLAEEITGEKDPSKLTNEQIQKIVDSLTIEQRTEALNAINKLITEQYKQKQTQEQQNFNQLCKALTTATEPAPITTGTDIEVGWNKWSFTTTNGAKANVLQDEKGVIRYIGYPTQEQTKDYPYSTTQEGAYGIIQTRADKPLDTTVAENMDYNAYAMYIRTPVARRSYDTIETVPNKQNLPPGTPSQQWIGGSQSPIQEPERDATTAYSYDNIPSATGIFEITGMQTVQIGNTQTDYNGIADHDETSEHWEKTWVLSLITPNQGPDADLTFPDCTIEELQEQTPIEPTQEPTPNVPDQITPPIDCPEQQEITVPVPQDAEQIQAQLCNGPQCQPLYTTFLTRINCPNEAPIEYSWYEFTEPQQQPQQQPLAEQTLTPQQNTITNGQTIATVPVDKPVQATLKQADKTPKWENPYVTMITKPVKLELSEINEPITFTLTYELPELYNQKSISGFVQEGQNWKYIGGEINPADHTITFTIENPQQYQQYNTITVTAMAHWCTTCIEEWRQVYNNGDNAIILVHDVTTSPHTWKDLVSDITISQHTGQIWTYGYPLEESLDYYAQNLAKRIEQQNFPTIEIAAHGTGGTIIHKTLEYAKQRGMTFVNKINKVILIGSTTEPVQTEELYKNIFTQAINQQTLTNLLNTQQKTMRETIQPQYVQLQNIPYYLIAGSIGIPENDQYFTQNYEGEEIIESNDGLHTTQSTTTINGQTIGDYCDTIYVLPLSHNELITNEEGRQTILSLLQLYPGTKPLNKENTAPLQIKVPECKPGDKIIVTGKRTAPETQYAKPLTCTCGDNICGQSETIETCPTDCETQQDCNLIKMPITIFTLITTLLTIAYTIKKHKLHLKHKKIQTSWHVSTYTGLTFALIGIIAATLSCSTPIIAILLMLVSITAIILEVVK